MTIDRDQFKALATEFRDLQDANKDNVDKFLEKVEAQGIDRAGFRRLVAWKRQDDAKRAQREAIDQQLRYLAGDRDTPAELPIGCELALALNCFRRNMTVRQTAEEMGISTGKAGKLRQLAQMFDVHVHGRVDKRRAVARVTVITPPEAAALPAAPRDAKGNALQADADGEIIETESSEGRGVAERHENPAPHGQAPEEKGPSTPSHASALPIEAGQGRETAGNVAISEQPPERMPLAAPSLDPVPAGGAGNAGGSDARVAAPEPEVARAVPPVTDPLDDWDAIAAEQRRLNEASARFRKNTTVPA